MERKRTELVVGNGRGPESGVNLCLKGQVDF